MQHTVQRRNYSALDITESMNLFEQDNNNSEVSIDTTPGCNDDKSEI